MNRLKNKIQLTLKNPKFYVPLSISLFTLMALFAVFVQNKSNDQSPSTFAVPTGDRTGAGFGDAPVNGSGSGESWAGSYELNLGGTQRRAYCVEHGANYPNENPDLQGDLWGITSGSKTNTISDQHSAEAAYLLAEYGDTNDDVTAAAMMVLMHHYSAHRAGYGGIEGTTGANSWPGPTAPYLDAEDVDINNDTAWQGQEQAVRNKIDELLAEAQAEAIVGSLAAVIVVNTTHPNYEATITYTNTLDNSPAVGHDIDVTITGGSGSGTYTTNASGQIVIPVIATDTVIEVDAVTSNPLPSYQFWGDGDMTGNGAQEVVAYFPGESPTASAMIENVTNDFQVLKTSSNPAYQSVTGAEFTLTDVNDSNKTYTVTVGANGSSNVVAIDLGTYHVVETVTPDGHLTPILDDITVDGSQNPYVLEVVNDAREEGRVELNKFDAFTGESVAGAEFQVDYDSDDNGSYETNVPGPGPGGVWVSGDTPTSVDGLAEGNYQVTEVNPPPLYLPPDTATQALYVDWDGSATINFENERMLTINTNASSQSVLLGESVTDSMTVVGLRVPQNAKIFVTAYGPFASNATPTCNNASLVTTYTLNITEDGTYTSPEYLNLGVGKYTFVALIETEGDGRSATHECGQAEETFTVKPPVTIDTQVSNQEVLPGEPVFDTANVTGLEAGESATITANIYGPFNSVEEIVCTGSPVQTASFDVTGTGTYEDPDTFQSPDFFITEGGIYTFVETIVVTDGRSDDHPCGQTQETFTQLGVIELSTTASTQVTSPGKPVFDYVLVSGLESGKTASILAEIYGPFPTAEDITCDGEPIATATFDVTGSGVFQSPEFMLDELGVYTFLETLTADDGRTATHDCGLEAETFSVLKEPKITTQVNKQQIDPGDTVIDKAIVEGLDDGEEATITASLYGPFNSIEESTCTEETLAQTQTFDIVGSGTFDSPEFTVDTPGVFTFIETLELKNDTRTANHECGLAEESFTVTGSLIKTGQAAKIITAIGAIIVLAAAGLFALKKSSSSNKKE